MTWKSLPQWVLDDAGIETMGGTTEIPYFAESGVLHNTRVINYWGKQYWAETGRGLIPYGLQWLASLEDAATRSLFLAEGESDALALRALRGGMDVLGLPGASTFRPEFLRYAGRYARVYVCGDGDVAGQKLNRVVKDAWPDVRIVELPEGEDVRKLLQSPDGVDWFWRWVARADLNADLYRLRFVEGRPWAEVAGLVRDHPGLVEV